MTVLARDDEEAFDVSPEEENALLAAIAQTERGEAVWCEELRERLRRFGRLLRRIQGPSRALPLIVDIAWRGSGIIEIGRIAWQISWSELPLILSSVVGALASEGCGSA